MFDRLFKSKPAATPAATPNDRPKVESSARSVSIDAPTLMKLRNLELRARAVVDGFMAGIHRSPYHGFSVEFTDYRQYSPGDDVRYVDWKLFARQDRYYIKRFEDETNLRCYLVGDLSRSMDFGSLGYTKADYARTALATVGYFLSQQRDAVGLLTFDETIGEYIPPRYRPGHLRRLLLGLERSTGGKRTDLAPPLQQVTQLARRRGLVILASDLIAPIENLERQLSYLRSQRHEVVVMRILDPQEIHFDFDDPKIFEDMESGKQLFVDPVAIRKNYLQRFNDHSESIHEICQRQGVELIVMPTDRPMDALLSEFVRLRGKAKQTVRRKASSAQSLAGGVA